MILEDFVMLGKTVPEPTSEKLEHYVCSAGYAAEHGLVRLYPLGMQGTPRRWSVSCAPVERFPGNKDNRHETWKPVGAFGNTGTLPAKERRKVLEQFEVSGTAEANERKLSLAVIRATAPVLKLESTTPVTEAPYLLSDMGEVLKARDRFPHVPRLHFKTADGRGHKLQVRDWGVWELMRKYHDRMAAMDDAGREDYVAKSLRITDDTFLLIGNFAQHRTSWLIIAALNVP